MPKTETEDRYSRYGYAPDDDLHFFSTTSGLDDHERRNVVVHLRDHSEQTNPDQVTDWLLGRQRSTCGVTTSIYNGISDFYDDQLCRRCMKHLGDQTLRVFER